MAYTRHQKTIEQLADLDFAGKGESFVEQRFLAPLLECLGYESHKDYEVVRHGDDKSRFKLRYPPVEKGAQRVKSYDPDYIPTIRKKMFWIIEAKSTKSSYPFAGSYTTQGLQYCIHPEIQAKYLVVSNGRHTVVHDAHGSVFLELDPYIPILTFASSELPTKWPEVYELLSVERLRGRIETDLKAMYDKLCLSSLDEQYPHELWRRIGSDAAEHAQAIKKHVAKLYVEDTNATDERWRREIGRLASVEILRLMDGPLRPGTSEASYYVSKALAEGNSVSTIFDTTVRNFDQQTIFRKEQSVVAAAALYQSTEDEDVKAQLIEFFERIRNYDLPILNQVECTLLRLTRKRLVLSVYPALHERIGEELKQLPELVRYVRPPSALDNTYAAELDLHAQSFATLAKLNDETLLRALRVLLHIEERIDEDFRRARERLPERDRQIGGLEGYGVGGKHYAFKNILVNYRIHPKRE